ncbi:MFS transporter [Erwinia piriflorinigrans]|uniref:Putative anion transporter 2 n=1 Tax=Erwinia piriflorinigrans CFBP 5888 TaxID=1161919 RepID=V5Z483_9GAMM|nr:MFS transporter [Erwinia piriflorinigrans]CCG86082.1 putative anion transporter 2 [Erwinia piriflorinigrans CFBP 5888]
MNLMKNKSTKVLALFCALSFLMYVDRVNLSASAALIKEEIGLDNTELGIVFSAFAYTYLVFQIIGGWFCDRFGARNTIIICGSIWIIATICTGFAGGFISLFLSRLLLGIGEGAALPSQARAITFWFKKEKRGFVQGITHAFSRFGNAVTPSIVALLVLAHSWRFSFIAMGLITAVWLALWILWFRDTPHQYNDLSKDELEQIPPADSQVIEKTTEPTPWGALLKRMGPTMGVYFCYGWTGWLFFTWLPMFFMNGRGMDIKSSALFTSGVFLFGVLGNMVGGVVSDYIYKRTRNVVAARRNVIIFSFLSALLLLIPVINSSSLTVISLCLGVAFFCLELTIGPVWAIPMDITPKHVGIASGLMNAGSAVAGIISPILFGIIIDKTGDWSLPFYGSIVLLLFGIVLTFFMRPDIPLQANHALEGTLSGL